MTELLNEEVKRDAWGKQMAEGVVSCQFAIPCENPISPHCARSFCDFHDSCNGNSKWAVEDIRKYFDKNYKKN